MWGNLKNITHTLFSKLVSPFDCLDMVSQTSSGQEFLKQLQIDVDRVAWMRVMDGVLLRILKRMRGLQSVELHMGRNWKYVIPDSYSLNDNPVATKIWHQRTAKDFLILVGEELSHVKKITMSRSKHYPLGDTTIYDWMADELKKRNEAWAPPLPSYKNFRRTVSPMSIMNDQVAKSVLSFEDGNRSIDTVYYYSKGLRGVF